MRYPTSCRYCGGLPANKILSVFWTTRPLETVAARRSFTGLGRGEWDAACTASVPRFSVVVQEETFLSSPRLHKYNNNTHLFFPPSHWHSVHHGKKGKKEKTESNGCLFPFDDEADAQMVQFIRRPVPPPSLGYSQCWWPWRQYVWRGDITTKTVVRPSETPAEIVFMPGLLGAPERAAIGEMLRGIAKNVSTMPMPSHTANARSIFIVWFLHGFWFSGGCTT